MTINYSTQNGMNYLCFIYSQGSSGYVGFWKIYG